MRGLKRSRGRRAFTLLELMTVVFIIGILAAVAIPMLARYLVKSKTTEAALNLRKIYDGEISYYNEEVTTASGGVVSKSFVEAPSTPGSPGPNKNFGNFSTPAWGAIKFAPDGPVLFTYQVVTSGVGNAAAFTARAMGDIDGDSVTSLFERVGSVDSNTGEVVGGGALFTLDELE